MGNLELHYKPAVREAVYRELNQAVINGYTEIREWPARLLAHDLVTYSQEFETFHVEELVEFCEAWLNAEP